MDINLNRPASPAAVPSRSLTVEQMALLLALTETTVRTYATAKKYQHLLPRPFKRPGGRRLLWDEAEVLEWMRAGRAATMPRVEKRRGPPTKRERHERDALASAQQGVAQRTVP